MGSAPFRVVLTHALHPDAMEILDAWAQTAVADSADPEKLAPYLAQADALVFRYGKITRELMDLAPGLRAIVKPGVGTDGIDIGEATARGIAVGVCPPLNAQAVAEHTIALIFACGKDLLDSALETRGGNYEVRSRYASIDLAGKTVAVCGFGHIGRRVAAMCSALGMRVIVFSRGVTAEELEKLGYSKRDSIMDAARECDFLTLHLPANEQTAGIVDARVLGAMKPSAYLINTARGALVDEAALIDSLRSGRLAGAGLDLLRSEPISGDNPLLHMDRVIVTPHMAALTRETARLMSVCAAEAVIRLLRGERWKYTVNPDALKHRGKL